MERYFYFRDVADEANDSSATTSVMVPVKNITGIGPASDNVSLNVWFLSGKNETHNSVVDLTVTEGKMKEVTEELVSAMNASAPHNGVVVVYDALTTVDDNNTPNISIQGKIVGNDGTVATRSLSEHITGAAITSG